MSEEPVLLSEDRDETRILTLNRPSKLNAMNDALVHGLVDAVDAAHADDQIATIVLTGSERAFSRGSGYQGGCDAPRCKSGRSTAPRGFIARHLSTG